LCFDLLLLILVEILVIGFFLFIRFQGPGEVEVAVDGGG